MSVIKYTIKFKRILLVNVNQAGKMAQMRVGEVENFQQHMDGTLDIVAYIWPQTPEKVREQIEKNPGMLGMTAETLPVLSPLVFPDGTKFDEVDQPCEHFYVSGHDGKGVSNRLCLKCWQPHTENKE